MMNDAIILIDELPSIQTLKAVCQALGLLDAILMPDWEYRYFSFNSNWDGSGKEMMSSMRDGSGSEYFIHFSDNGAVAKVLHQDTLDNTLDVIKNIPECFHSFKTEAAFSLEYMTYCFWRRVDDKEWSVLLKGLCEFPLLKFLVDGVDYYHEWAENYYERPINRYVLQSVFESRKITSDELAALNPAITLDDLFVDLDEIVGKVAL